MFDKVEFGDLHRFKTSIGLLLIAFGFILPWLFIKQESELLISIDNYKQLTKVSKALIDQKIEFSLWIVNSLPFFSSSFIIIGFSLTLSGYLKWQKKQKIVDATDQINFDLLSAGVTKQSSNEIQKDAENQIIEEIDDLEDSEEQNSQNEITEKSDIINDESTNKTFEEKKKIINQSRNLIEMENLFYQKIISYNSFNYQVHNQMQIGGNYKVDFLLNSYNSNKYSDFIVEIKYLQNSLSMKLVRDSFKNLTRAHSYYLMKSKRKCKMVFIIVYTHDISDNEEIARFKLAISEFQEETKYLDRIIFCITDKEAKDFNVNSFIK